jgi:hypothetical protein
VKCRFPRRSSYPLPSETTPSPRRDPDDPLPRVPHITLCNPRIDPAPPDLRQPHSCDPSQHTGARTGTPRSHPLRLEDDQIQLLGRRTRRWRIPGLAVLRIKLREKVRKHRSPRILGSRCGIIIGSLLQCYRATVLHLTRKRHQTLRVRARNRRVSVLAVLYLSEEQIVTTCEPGVPSTNLHDCPMLPRTVGTLRLILRQASARIHSVHVGREEDGTDR